MIIRDLLPPKARKTVYSILAAVTAAELALDLVGWGFIPTGIQAKAVIVASALGFTLAAGNVTT